MAGATNVVTNGSALAVGTTSTAGGQFSVISSDTIAIYGQSSTTNSSSYPIILRNSAVTNLFYVRSDGYTFTGTQTLPPYNYATTGRAVYVDSAGGLGYLSSVKASKTNIANMDSASWIYNLNPVSFNYRKKNEDNQFTDVFEIDKNYGLIAEEVEQINKDLCLYDQDGTLRGVSYEKLYAPMIKAIQELNDKIEAQQREIETLKLK